MQVYDSTTLDALEEKAKSSPRQRAAQALKGYEYTGVRPLLNAMLPGTYVQPHRHNLENADEYWLTLRGKIAAFSFSEDGKVNDFKIASSRDGFPLVFIPRGEYHTLVVVDEPSLILEITQGPYNPETYKEFAQWAPSESPEDEERARAFLHTLERHLK